MSEGQVTWGTSGAAATNGSQARAAIARASEATGVNFQYLLAQAKLESSLDSSARAPTSSAAGLYQFTQGTWLETLSRHGAEHGMAWVNDVIRGGQVSDPSARSQVMGLRYDPNVSAMMAAELASDNKADLTAQLGREPDATELYMAHFLGIAGAGKFLSALSSNPTQSAAAILPKAAAANRGIFYDGGAPRSVGAVMDLMRSKVSGAMDGGNAALWAQAASTDTTTDTSGQTTTTQAQLASWQPPMGPIAREFNAGLPAAQQASQVSSASRPSMAETLRDTFGTSSQAVPAQVRDAYAKLARFNL